MHGSRDLKLNAPRLWASGLIGFLAADAYLVHNGRESASTWAARNWPLVLGTTIYLHLHFHGRPKRLAKYDPLHLAAERLRRKAAEVISP